MSCPRNTRYFGDRTLERHHHPNFDRPVLIGPVAIEKFSSAHADGLDRVEEPGLFSKNSTDILSPCLGDPEIHVHASPGVGVPGR